MGQPHLLWATCATRVIFLNTSSKPTLFPFGSILPCPVLACPCPKSLFSFLVGCRQVLEGHSSVEPKPKCLLPAEQAQLSQPFLAGEVLQRSLNLGVPRPHLLQPVRVLAVRAGEPGRAGCSAAGAASPAWRRHGPASGSGSQQLATGHPLARDPGPLCLPCSPRRSPPLPRSLAHSGEIHPLPPRPAAPGAPRRHLEGPRPWPQRAHPKAVGTQTHAQKVP